MKENTPPGKSWTRYRDESEMTRIEPQRQGPTKGRQILLLFGVGRGVSDAWLNKLSSRGAVVRRFSAIVAERCPLS